MTSKQRIRFVTDSTCDLPPEIIAQYGIVVVPCYINYNNGSFADDNIELDRREFYRQLPTLNPHPTTAAMPTGIAEQKINEALVDADHLFVLTVASGLSAVYNVMRLAAQNTAPDRITLINSESATMGLGLLVQIGAEVAEATGDPQQVEAAILSARANMQVFAALDTLKYLQRSGRVSWAAANVGTLLQIKPVISVHGNVVNSVARVRTFKRALDDLVARVEAFAPLDRLAIIHVASHQAALDFKTRLGDLAPEKTYVTMVGPTLGVHVGIDGVGVAMVSQKWRT